MPKRRKAAPTRKMSEIMAEMLMVLLRDSDAVPSSEAAHVALFLANLAWNESVGTGGDREDYPKMWEDIEAENPDLWDELKSRDIEVMIDELVEYKKAHFPDDRRRIILCGWTPQGTIRVEWMSPVAPGVDPRWETALYAMVRMGEWEEAIEFLRRTRGMSLREARRQVARIEMELGML